MAIEEHLGTPATSSRTSVGRTSPIYDPKIRAIVFQAALALFLLASGWWLVGNVLENLRRANIASGFDFFGSRAGFEILFSLIPYSANDTYGRAFLVGLLNTVYVAVIGVVLATMLGFLVGIARLSSNWILRSLATVYVEFFRNIPLLLQLLFWYKAVLSLLPGPRQGYALWDSVFLNNRGLIMPRPLAGAGAGLVLAAFAVAIVGVVLMVRWANRRRIATGQPFPTLQASLVLLIGLPFVAFVLAGGPFRLDTPALKGFNFVGGMVIAPEFMALLLGLTIYTAAFISEIVRAGILSVSHGQTEAAAALGFRSGLTLRLVVIPQAMRVIIPPLTNQYLNLTKNSSLAVAIGYPDLVSIFAGTVLNQTGQAVEVILITMLVYLTLSVGTSTLMNEFNRRMALVQR